MDNCYNNGFGAIPVQQVAILVSFKMPQAFTTPAYQRDLVTGLNPEPDSMCASIAPGETDVGLRELKTRHERCAD